MNHIHLEAIRRFEGFAPTARWDYQQASNGYGTRAAYVGEVIDKAEAERRFASEVEEARLLVQQFAPGVDEGTAAALTSLTFNAGTSWMRSGLGAAVKANDLQAAQEIFKQYSYAGGKQLPGLVARREAEASWFGQPALITDVAATDRSVTAEVNNTPLEQAHRSTQRELLEPSVTQTAAQDHRKGLDALLSAVIGWYLRAPLSALRDRELTDKRFT